MTGETLTVSESACNHIPQGTTFNVERDHTNQFSGRRVLTLSFEGTVAQHVGTIQVYQMPDDVSWTEIHLGLSREHDEINFEEEV